MYGFIIFAKQVLSLPMRIALLAGAALLVFFLALPAGLLQPLAVRAQTESTTPLGEPPANAQQVVVGFYPINVYNLDIANNTYFIDTYAWFRWQGDINPLDTVEFVNAVDEWSLLMTFIDEEPITLSDGSSYQSLRIEGRFVQPFNLTDFPLDRQQLTILIEDSTYTSEQLVYLPDNVDGGYGEQLKIPGWDIMGWHQASLLHQYGSKFGEIDSDLSTTYATLEYQLAIQRPINFFIWKLLLPLLIIIGAHWCAFLLHPSLVDARTAIPSTALLTLVFLQQSYSASLPEVGYLVLMDKIYVIAYLLTIVTLVEGITTALWVRNDNEATFQRVRRLDRVMLFVELALFAVGIAWILLTRG